MTPTTDLVTRSSTPAPARTAGPNSSARRCAFLANALALAAALAFLMPPPASGCSITKMSYPGLFSTGELARLPTNAAGLVWNRRDEIPPPQFVVERIAPTVAIVPHSVDSTALPSPLKESHLLIRVTEGFEAGATYVFRVVGDPARDARVEVGERAVQARGTARLELGTTTRQNVETGLCDFYGTEVGILPVYLRLPLEARDHDAELVYQTLVDGEPWYWQPDLFAPGVASREGRARDGLVFNCDRRPADTPELLAPGRYRVELTASLPGTDIAWSASADVDLKCPAK